MVVVVVVVVTGGQAVCIKRISIKNIDRVKIEIISFLKFIFFPIRYKYIKLYYLKQIFFMFFKKIKNQFYLTTTVNLVFFSICIVLFILPVSPVPTLYNLFELFGR